MANQGPRKLSELAANEPVLTGSEAAPPPLPPAPPMEAMPQPAAPQADLGELRRISLGQSMPERRPFGRQEYKLSGYATDPTCVPRWFNDTPGRIMRALQAGYRHVNDRESGGKVALGVGTAERGGGLNAYLMEIPKQWYDEDFAAKMANLDITVRAIMRGKHKVEPDDKRYGEVGMRVTGARRPMAHQQQ